MPTANASIREIFERLEIEPVNSGACYGDWIASPAGGELASLNPATGETLARVRLAGPADYECVVARAREAFPRMADDAGAASAARSCARSAMSCARTRRTWARW